MKSTLRHTFFVSGIVFPLLCSIALALEEVPPNAGYLVKPGATFISTWSLGDDESGALGFVVDKIDPDTDEIIGRLYEPSNPETTRAFTAILETGQVESTLTLRCKQNEGLERDESTTPTAQRFLQAGRNVSLKFMSNEDAADSWKSTSEDIKFNGFRSRGIGYYEKRIEENKTVRAASEEKIFEAVKKLTVWSGSWTSKEGKTGSIAIQFGSDPNITEKTHLVGRFFDMDAPHKAKPFTGSITLGGTSKQHFAIKTDNNGGITENLAKTESHELFLTKRSSGYEYTTNFTLNEKGELEGQTSSGLKLTLKKITAKEFMEKINTLKTKDDARRAAIIEAVKPGSVYKGVATNPRDAWTGEIGFRFETYDAQGHVITGEMFELSAPDLKVPFQGQLTLGPDTAISISFQPGRDRPHDSEMKTQAGKDFIGTSALTNQVFRLSVNDGKLVGENGRGYQFVLTRTE